MNRASTSSTVAAGDESGRQTEIELKSQILSNPYINLTKLETLLRKKFGEKWKVQVGSLTRLQTIVNPRLTQPYQVKLGRFILAVPELLKDKKCSASFRFSIPLEVGRHQLKAAFGEGGLPRPGAEWMQEERAHICSKLFAIRLYGGFVGLMRMLSSEVSGPELIHLLPG
ncbi:hypothetical protein PV11_08274 [Exophiala sideris]|uniref:Uncharacterized protein n=1 Tax=Exophiala sideris TaxID=1016849 RepID=A0A0D1Z1N7_9EURO|nr:hypothetical protein PV11_08274 [Exophiala sideris]